MERGGTDKAAERRFVPDARMVGKWYKAERGETINIFPEEPLRMKMSFSSSGHCNFTPNCVYADGDALCWETTTNTTAWSTASDTRTADCAASSWFRQNTRKNRKWQAHTPRMPRRSGGCSALLFEKTITAKGTSA